MLPPWRFLEIFCFPENFANGAFVDDLDYFNWKDHEDNQNLYKMLSNLARNSWNYVFSKISMHNHWFSNLYGLEWVLVWGDLSEICGEGNEDAVLGLCWTVYS